MGIIVRNGNAYGGHPAIDAEKDQLIIGNGENWIEGGKLFLSELFFEKPYRSESITNFIYTDLSDISGADSGYTESIVIGDKPKKTIVNEKEKWEYGKNHLLLSDSSEIEFYDNSKLSVHGNSVIDIGDSPMTTIPESNSLIGKIKGPNILLHGTSNINIDSGASQIAPNVIIHGNAFIDISDTSISPTSYYSSSNYMLRGRHPEAGGLPSSFGNKPAPWLHLHGFASLIMDNGSLLSLHDSAAFIGNGNGRLSISDSANITFSNNIVFHGQGGDFIINGGNTRITNGDYNFMNGMIHFGGYGNPQLTMMENPVIHINGNGHANICYDGNIHINNRNSDIGGSTSKGHDMEIDILDSPNIQIDGAPQLQIRDHTLFRMQDTAYFQMQSVLSNGSGYAGPGPALTCDCKQFIFISRGAKGPSFSNNGHPWNNGLSNDAFNFSKNSIDQVRFLLQDNVTSVIGGQKGKVFIDIKGSKGGTVEIYASDNSFIQRTGNSHEEIHDESIIIMRGHASIPWKDGWKGEDTHLGKDWTRSADRDTVNGPDVELYDAPVIRLRGHWSETEKTSISFSTTYSFSSLNAVLANSIAKKSFEEALEKNNLEFVEVTEDTEVEVKNGSCFVRNIICKPINWSSYAIKQSGSPIVEIIEDAEVKVYGSSSIILTDIDKEVNGEEYQAGLTLKFGEEKIHFTIEKLKSLAESLS